MTLKSSLAAAAALVLSASAVLADTATIHVVKDADCGCCEAWMDHLRDEGFDPRGQDVSFEALQAEKARLGVPAAMASCHTAQVDGYVIEGHVPAAEIRRLLAERPDAVGLAVPGMPMGSPGMDYGDARDSYQVLLIGRDGGAEPFATYPAD